MNSPRASFRFAGPLVWIAFALFALALEVRAAGAADYDPLSVRDAARSRTEDFVVHDAGRGREIPIRVYFPPADTAAPIVLFSHGLGGSRENNPYLGNHWSARGYVAVFLQHPGSDSAVWREAGFGRRMAAMKKAASLENFGPRVRDVPAVLDQLAAWNAAPVHPLHGRLDMERIGMSGHSFGAITTQAVSGKTFPGGSAEFAEPRIRAALAMSPSSPRIGDTGRAFAAVRIPWMLMTGTLDDSPIGGATPGSRLEVFPALPPGDKFELVLLGAKHSAFSERALPMDRGARNPNHHRAILALSTAFWDAYLLADPDAKAWLACEGARTVLEPGDRWQLK